MGQRLEAPALSSWTCLQPRSPPCGDPSLGRPRWICMQPTGLKYKGTRSDRPWWTCRRSSETRSSPSSREAPSLPQAVKQIIVQRRAAPALPVGRRSEAEPPPIDQPAVQHHLGKRKRSETQLRHKAHNGRCSRLRSPFSSQVEFELKPGKQTLVAPRAEARSSAAVGGPVGVQATPRSDVLISAATVGPAGSQAALRYEA